MPPKPVERAKGSGLQYYNVDFSLQTQLQLAGAATPEMSSPNCKFMQFQPYNLLGNPENFILLQSSE